jgi:hypothetical protein
MREDGQTAKRIPAGSGLPAGIFKQVSAAVLALAGID